MRHICYVSGTRADYGLMEEVLHAIEASPELSLSILITGMHLLSAYGDTYKEIEAAGFDIHAKVPVNLSGGGGAEMAHAVGEEIIGFTAALNARRPDLLLLLGDRGEMLAAAIAAIHLNIPIVHLHGGERSGTVDESIRHAVSKLSHYHFVASSDSRTRLIKMGEQADNVFVTGAPGLDAIYSAKLQGKENLAKKYQFDAERPFQLILFHPVVQQASIAEEQMQTLLDAVLDTCEQPLIIMPNADSGASGIVSVINRFCLKERHFKSVLHIPRNDYLSLVAGADVLIGNSSSGIIEAASLQTPVVNVGDRQNARERNANVLDVAPAFKLIKEAILVAKQMKGKHWDNCYGDGNSAERIVQYLRCLSLDAKIMEKLNAY